MVLSGLKYFLRIRGSSSPDRFFDAYSSNSIRYVAGLAAFLI
jgi:hypothetical protein